MAHGLAAPQAICPAFQHPHPTWGWLVLHLQRYQATPCHSCEIGDREAGGKWSSCLQQTGQHSHGPGMPPTAHVRTTYHDRPVAHIELGLSGDQGLLVLPDNRGDLAKGVQVLGAGNAAGKGHQVTEVEGGTEQVGQPTQVGQGWGGD